MWPFRKRGPTRTEELLEDACRSLSAIFERVGWINERLVDNSCRETEQTQSLTELIRTIASSGPAMTGRSLAEAEKRLTDILELMRQQPFAALKTWIEANAKSDVRLGKIADDYRLRERQLMESWNKHLDGMKSQIQFLQSLIQKPHRVAVSDDAVIHPPGLDILKASHV